MAKIDRKELYALFYALHRHQAKQDPIEGIKIDDEIADAIARFARKHDNKPGRPEGPLTTERVKSILKSVKHDPQIRILVIEDGPETKRPKTREELQEEKQAQEAEAERLFRKFWVSASYGVTALIGSISVGIWYQKVIAAAPRENVSGPMLESVGDAGLQMHPLKITSLILMLIAAWGIAEAVVIAKNHWADFDRVKGAVPVVGQAWLARTKRKRRERERKLANLDERS